MLFGLWYRWRALRTLGQYFTADVAVFHDHPLIERGLYKYIRHPSYTGSLLMFWGLGLVLNNWLSLIVLLVVPSLCFYYRIRVEEKVLLQQLGEFYHRYLEHTERIIPFVF